MKTAITATILAAVIGLAATQAQAQNRASCQNYNPGGGTYDGPCHWNGSGWVPGYDPRFPPEAPAYAPPTYGWAYAPPVAAYPYYTTLAYPAPRLCQIGWRVYRC